MSEENNKQQKQMEKEEISTRSFAEMEAMKMSRDYNKVSKARGQKNN